MRQQVEDNRTEAPPAEEVLMEGKTCSLTKRIMTVSPFPERMNSLLHLLTAECFDLFALHDLNKAFVSSLQPELIIYDATPNPLIPNAVDALHAAMTHTSPINGASLLFLVHEEARVMAAAIPDNAELLVWPSNPQDALKQITRMLGEWKAPDQSSYKFKDLTVDLKKMAVYRGEERIELTKTEYDLLLMFLASDGAVLTREVMFDAVWGSQYFGGSNVVDVHIKTLRRKLKDSAVAPNYIATVRGAGYRLVEHRGN
ncbi:winged helix-turn-helix domain-containing protein [Paenibacillus glycanilyticus]|uniref:OmpR/PhoB-type domain-containing protein n=1 Tax=Paenibacillus glycanilyticus TaxID=126569 RepID=A0ABQ6GII0_9BACL|nr:winged helix-turn-helix domain-containing protein [Paenibacillus glycanilyticus]GLX70058.1 hypothetical protein MU1_44040 [Paenibacillus glycanilyticus]